MSSFSIVTSLVRERIAREFDDRGPEVCTTEVIADLARNNPELLEMATRCASGLQNSPRIMMGFGMFYRLMRALGRARHRAFATQPSAARQPRYP